MVVQSVWPPGVPAGLGIEDPDRLGDTARMNFPSGQLLLPAVGKELSRAKRGRGHQQRLHRRTGLLGTRAQGLQYLGGDPGCGLDQAAHERQLRSPVHREGTRPHHGAEQHQRAGVAVCRKLRPRLQAPMHLLPPLAVTAHIATLGSPGRARRGQGADGQALCPRSCTAPAQATPASSNLASFRHADRRDSRIMSVPCGPCWRPLLYASARGP